MLNFHAFHVIDEIWGDLGGFEPGGFGQRVRRFAIDAYRILGHPDSPPVEVIRLYRRAWSLLRDAPRAGSNEIRRWLLAALQAIDTRILAQSFAELESWVA
jgi:hypothetical protein